MLGSTQVHPDTVKLIDQLLDDHTDAETAQQLNQAGRRSGTGQPFSSGIVVHIRREYGLPSHRDRLRAQGLLTMNDIAEQLDVGTSTIKAWRAAGLLTGHTANDKNERLYEPPAADDPRLVKHHGRRLRNQESMSSIRVIEPVLVTDQRAGQRAQLEQPVPVSIVSRKSGALEPEHDPRLAQRYVGDESREPLAVSGRGARHALVDVDHVHPLERPAERDRAPAQVILAPGKLGVVDDLMQARLSHIQVRVAA